MGSLPSAHRTESEVTAVEVSIKKEDRSKLSMSDMVKLSKLAREGGSANFMFFASNGKLVNDFQAVYDLHIWIEAISKALTHYDMKDLFHIILAETAKDLSVKLEMLFDCQSTKECARANLVEILPIQLFKKT